MSPTYCPLCHSPDIQSYSRDKSRHYLNCQQCQLVFVPTEQHLSAEQEKAVYDLHQNEIHDAGYRRFLSRLYTPLIERLPAGAQGLDFGCGPGPALAEMFREVCYPVNLYDCFYHPNRNALEKQYDFIVATEVVEHLSQPGLELQRLWQLLKPNGWLGLMTKLVIDLEAFNSWHYKNDLTHICFFSRATFVWLAGQWGATVEFAGSDVILLHKPAAE
ncbi:class I SAM-dependent methyltransferase [Porticoccus sp. W117]|uniref:class I SAM-dependent methyltransferase n=1 Tax=Porticoccus sp. W117 TaxID=3054777 RepID=UPI002595E4A2|nr:class I SAM-dependent methyltransferase [Porticoccus sp. W117]MDM3871173.1 class I SAM-dependent methyltransferase [Porticoccus sp. W117]